MLHCIHSPFLFIVWISSFLLTICSECYSCLSCTLSGFTNQILHVAWIVRSLWELTGKKNAEKWWFHAVRKAFCWQCLGVDVNTVKRFFCCRIFLVVPEMVEQRYKVKCHQTERICAHAPLKCSNNPVSKLAVSVNPLRAVMADFTSQVASKVITCFVDS